MPSARNSTTSRGSFSQRWTQSRWPAFLSILAASLLAVVPLWLRGPSCGHDFDFHLLSWIEAAHDWTMGLAYPHWLVSANYGAGEPRFLFYPPLSWMLGALLGTISSVFVSPREAWTIAPVLFVWLSIFSAGCAVFLLARECASRNTAALAACLFVANPYLLFVAYERAAFSELLSTAWMALLLLLALRPRIAIAPAALLVALLWITNAPAAVMGCYLLGAIALLRLLLERRPMVAVRAALSCAAGTALAGFYVLPAAYEQRWVQIDRAVAPGMRVADSFFYGHTGNALHDQVLHTASSITVLLCGIGLLAAWISWHRRNGVGRRWSILVVLLLGLLFLQQRPSAFIWRFAPRLQYLQFPWRWLVVVGIIAACMVATAVDGLKRQRAIRFVAGIAIVASIWACSRHFFTICDVDDTAEGQLRMFHDGSGVEGTDEYTLKGADNSAILQDIPQVRVMRSIDAELPPEGAADNPEWISDWNFPTTAQATFKVTAWDPQRRQVQIDAKEPAFAVLTLENYPAWHVYLNGVLQPYGIDREDGLIAVAVPAGKSNVDVEWKNTPDIAWGRELSAAAALLLAAIGALDLRFRKPDPA